LILAALGISGFFMTLVGAFGHGSEARLVERLGWACSIATLALGLIPAAFQVV
jgi:hypothetical protein